MPQLVLMLWCAYRTLSVISLLSNQLLAGNESLFLPVVGFLNWSGFALSCPALQLPESKTWHSTDFQRSAHSIWGTDTRCCPHHLWRILSLYSSAPLLISDWVLTRATAPIWFDWLADAVAQSRWTLAQIDKPEHLALFAKSSSAFVEVSCLFRPFASLELPTLPAFELHTSQDLFYCRDSLHLADTIGFQIEI